MYTERYKKLLQSRKQIHAVVEKSIKPKYTIGDTVVFIKQARDYSRDACLIKTSMVKVVGAECSLVPVQSKISKGLYKTSWIYCVKESPHTEELAWVDEEEIIYKTN